MNYIPIHYQRKQRDVTRMNGNPMLRGYDLMQHGFGVLSLAIDLSRILHEPLTMEDMDVILRHDFAETVTSDLPYPIKNLSPEIKKAWNLIEEAALQSKEDPVFEQYSDANVMSTLGSDSKQWIFKFADITDLALTLWEEKSLGNRSLQVNRVIIKCADIMNSMLQTLEADWVFGDKLRLDVAAYLQSSKFPDILCPKINSHAELQ